MPSNKRYYVYILASYTQRLYVGMTSNLEKRMWQHKTKAFAGFTATYNINRLVYLEVYQCVNDAIARERQLKTWGHAKKVALFIDDNRHWRNLCLDYFDWAEQFNPYDRK